MRKSESKESNEIVELLRSARNDIANKNFAAAVAGISAALDEFEPRMNTNKHE